MTNSLSKEISAYLSEAARDAKILRNINIDHIKKEVPKNPDEEIRDYFARIQKMERDPEYANPVFPKAMVDWVESLPDNHFPRNGRKRFAKWVANSIYHHETETMGRIDGVDDLESLQIYNNDLRYIADFLNGADNLPGDLWDKSLNGMYDLAVEWHETLKGIESTGNYESKDIVYNFGNGFTIVNVKNKNDLETEGELMGHCVGGYCDYVEVGAINIYSLRDARNKPHATIEVRPGANPRNSVEQIKGKGNHAPVEKYRSMIKQWLDTTNFNYQNSEDYLNLLTSEEIKEKLFAGELGLRTEKNLMGNSDDLEVIDYFLDQLGSGDWSTPPPAHADRTMQMTKYNMIDNIARNANLNEEQRIRLLKINLNFSRPHLGVRASAILGDAVGGRAGQELHIDSRSLVARAWNEFDGKLGLFDGKTFNRELAVEQIYYMKAFMSHREAEMPIKEKIIEYITSEHFLDAHEAYAGSHGLSNNTMQPYGSIVQEYLFSQSPSSKNLRRIYVLMRDERFSKILGTVGRIQNYIAGCRAMSDEIATEIIDDIKNNRWWQLTQGNWIELINNPQISDSKRMDLLNVGRHEDEQRDRSIANMMQPGAEGLKWYISGRSWSRQFVNAAKNGKYSPKFVKYMIDAGIFDPEYVNLWSGEISKQTGKAPRLEKITGTERDKILIMVRDRAQKDFEKGLFSQEIFEDKDMEKLEEEIKVYLKKQDRPWGNTEDILEEDAEIIEGWVKEILDADDFQWE